MPTIRTILTMIPITAVRTKVARAVITIRSINNHKIKSKNNNNTKNRITTIITISIVILEITITMTHYRLSKEETFNNKENLKFYCTWITITTTTKQ